MTPLRRRMLEDLRIRNYAPTTVECYIRSVAEFAKHFNKPPDQLGPEEIRSWQLFLLNEKRVKLSTYIQAVCALRFFYQNTLHRRIEIDRIPLPRYEKKLPVILSKAEVKALLEAPKNLKHRAMLATMYGAGLRVSEVASLKVSDLDRERHVDLGSRRQRPQGQTSDAGRASARSARGVLALEASHRMAFPRQKAGLPDREPVAFSELARRRRRRPASPSRFIRIRCATRSPRICWTRE